MKTFFEYDLEENKETTDSGIHYAVRYIKEAAIFVEIGDSYRHNIFIKPNHWNRLLRLIRDDELDGEGIAAILSLMRAGLREEYEKTFITAIKSGAIKEVRI
ncbi:hypothetical protein HYU18_00010 [Candidatus Woesearchaeota archaeon]|nr:hypothetical protein [Candidatus Woesearchaeota archaeon]